MPTVRIRTITQDVQPAVKTVVSNVMKRHAWIARAVSVLRAVVKTVFVVLGKTAMTVRMAVVTKDMLDDMVVLQNTI